MLARSPLFFRRVLIGLAVLAGALAHADSSRPGLSEAVDDAQDAWTWKLTPSHYATTNQPDATDLNLRAHQGPHALWLGYYVRGGEFDQWRTGYEYTLERPWGRFIPSLQLATHEFAGMSLNLEAGRTHYLLLGFGRTNVRDYYNLNFDPNDAITYGVGTRVLPRTTLLLYTVRDDRLQTGQVITHLVTRLQLDDAHRLTLDLSQKEGSASIDEPRVSGQGVALGYDFRQLFIKVARDGKVNFSTEDQTRIALGLRF